MHYQQLETPALLIDRQIMLDNLKKMQSYADRNGVFLRPHTKTHKTPALALLQQELGARGITVAKVGEAEVMADAGLQDIFIANEIVGESKLQRIADLQNRCQISFGLDSVPQARMIERVFARCQKVAQVLVEIEVGENRSGMVEEQEFLDLLEELKTLPHVNLIGVFSHDGASYSAESIEAARADAVVAQQCTLSFANLAREKGFLLSVVSIGSTPSLANECPILPGITELRPGTYIFMDASQGHAVQDMTCCAATVLSTVISRPTAQRVILDVGAKGLTMQSRSQGICATPGLGTIMEYPNTHIHQMYDEHAIIYDGDFREKVQIGDKVRIIPVHICPVVNLYDTLYLMDSSGEVTEQAISCRGKLT